MYTCYVKLRLGKADGFSRDSIKSFKYLCSHEKNAGLRLSRDWQVDRRERWRLIAPQFDAVYLSYIYMENVATCQTRTDSTVQTLSRPSLKNWRSNIVCYGIHVINKTVNSFVTAFMFSCVLKNINKTVNSFKGCCVIQNNISKTDVQIVIAVVADYSNLVTF